ncbi:MAG: phosphoenolpyruvate carboxykinase (ATP) [Candidatus Diapherotrites archaeon]|nr:phosphoenolpyruvate carboxykinase (ATP) [Candidatus Diapherotrites archaeon]
MNYLSEVNELISNHANLKENIDRKQMIKEAVENKECVVSKNGALATWTPTESTGRSPKNTFIVENSVSKNIDWNSPNNIALKQELFNEIFKEAIKLLKEKNTLYVTDRVLGADAEFALPVKTITDKALHSLFVDNMFRAIPKNINESIFTGKEFNLLVLPYNKLDSEKFKELPSEIKTMAVAIDFENRIGIVFGSAYLGSVKKLMFTAMNYYLPEKGILPLHCSANEGINESALLLGLSGTGKTTLSADKNRALLGDDEHGWSDKGIFNFENGCYAKLIDLKKEKEPEIFEAIMHKADYLNHGAIIENAMIYPSLEFDFFDSRFTPNSRGSYLLSCLENIKKSSVSGHPKTILFLTADANGVLPPVSRLNAEQAMLWFLMGYTSKLAGTETGIVEPKSTFSRFFGEPFMPRNPNDYIKLFGEKLKKFNSKVYLINTGWSGGIFGIGKRIDLKQTRAMVNACLNGSIEKSKFNKNELFHLEFPETIEGVDSNILNPVNTWKDKNEFNSRAKKLAEEFSNHFDKAYGSKNIPKEIELQCPGK